MSWFNYVRMGLLGLMCLVGGAAWADEPASDEPATQADELESAVDQLGIEPSERTALRVVLDPHPEGPALSNKRTELRMEVVDETDDEVEQMADEPADGEFDAEDTDGEATDAPEADSTEAIDEASTDADETATGDDSDSITAESEAAESDDADAANAPKQLKVPAPPQDLATPELSPRLLELRAKVRRVLSWYFNRNLNTRDHNPWEMMHGVIAYGCDTKVRRGGPDGQPLNGIAWLSVNGECHGVRLLTINRRGELDAQVGQYVQGHPGQLMAILAQSHVPMNYPIHTHGREFTMRDLIETEMKSCEAGTELTFKLMGLSHYLDTESTWKDHRGGTWSIPRLIQEEIKQPILYTAACGGTHRLMGLSYCNFKRVKEGRPIDGQFARAKKYVQDYHRYAFALQNPDGSFSTDWFKGRQNKPDTDRKLKTTGHITEWLAFSLPEDQLTDPRMVRAVEFIASILDEGHGHKWEIGPIGHGLHALRIYDRRLFKPLDLPTAKEPPLPLAGEKAETTTAEVASKGRRANQRSTDKPGQPERAAAPETSEDTADDADTESDELTCSGEEEAVADAEEETLTNTEDTTAAADNGANDDTPSDSTANEAPAARSAIAIKPGEAVAPAQPSKAVDGNSNAQSPPARSRPRPQANPFRDGEIRTGRRPKTLR